MPDVLPKYEIFNDDDLMWIIAALSNAQGREEEIQRAKRLMETPELFRHRLIVKHFMEVFRDRKR